jgi:tetratricopeptide (TPR) repeat protein
MRAAIELLIAFALAAQGQNTDALLARIGNAPLPPEQRQVLAAAFSEKNYARVEAILGESGEAEPQALLGAIEFVGGRMDRAIQAFRKSDSVKTLNEPDRFTLAMALVDLGDTKPARVELSRLNESHPDQTIYLYWLARLDYSERLYDQSIEKLKRVIAKDPESVRGYDNLGLSYDMMGLSGDAQSAFTKAVALNRKLAAPSPWPPHNLGYLLLRLQKYHEAEENLREAVKYDPRFAEAHYHLGRVLEGQGRDDEAIAEYKSASSIDTKLAEPLYSLGLLYRRRGNQPEAEIALAEYKKRKAAVDSP